MIDALLTRVYRADIDFRLREAALTGDALTPLEALLDIRDIDDGWSAPWAGGRVVAARVSHGHGLGIDQADWCCLGYRIEGPDRVVAISGDAVECAGLDRLASGADLLVMCCYLARAEATERERAIVTRHILADPAAAGRVASRAGVGCLALTHLRQKTPALLAAVEAEARAAYSGRLVVGRDLLTL
jgi:ribonuclease Z